MEDKWVKLKGQGYRLVNLGRPAVFLLPSHKLRVNGSSGLSVEDVLHEFLIKEFGGYTSTIIPYFGVWRDEEETSYDECRRYEVSFVGQERIPILLAKLAEIAKIIEEECIYFQAGQYSCLVYSD